MTDYTELREQAQQAIDTYGRGGKGYGAMVKIEADDVLALLDKIDARGADIETHREIVQAQLAEIDRLRGLVKWASGRLFDADEVDDSNTLLQLIDDAKAQAPDDDKPDLDGAWPMPLACAFSDACPDGCRGTCATMIGEIDA